MVEGIVVVVVVQCCNCVMLNVVLRRRERGEKIEWKWNRVRIPGQPELT